MLRARFPGWTIPGDGANLADKARYPSGKGEVCKTFIRRFDSDPRLHFLQQRLPRDPSLCSGFRLRAPASLTPANRLKFDSDPRLQFLQLRLTRDPSLCSGFRLPAPASLTPANRLKFDSHPRLQFLQLRFGLLT